MLINDAKKYFSNSFTKSWQGISRSDLAFLKKFGADTKFIMTHLEELDDEDLDGEDLESDDYR